MHEEIDLLDYIVNKFGRKSAKEVYLRIEKMLERIADMPKAFPSSKKKKGLRKCVLSKQTSIYYRIHSDYIEVVSFRPNRKNPASFKP